jgi:hypothetical protein
MTETAQTILALLLVAGCVGYVARTAWKSLRARSGCGGGCGCEHSKQQVGVHETRPQIVSHDQLLRSVRNRARSS